MSIVIEKRTRAADTDPWGSWSSTTDAAPFTNTSLIQYRTTTDILFSDITSNVTTTNDANRTVTGDGVFDNLMEAFNTHMKAQYDLGRLKGTDYANVYLGGVQVAMQQAVQYVLQEKAIEKDLELKQAQLVDQEYITSSVRPQELIKLTEEIDLLQTQDVNAIASRQNDASKVVAELAVQLGYTSSTVDAATGLITLNARNSATALQDRQVKLQEDQFKLSKIPSGRG